MKKKIHDIRIMAALLMAGAAFTACSTDGNELITEQPQEQTPKTYTITIEATKDLGGDETTRGLELSGNELNSVWEVGEKVQVVQKNASDVSEVIGELTAQTAGATTTLTGTVNNSFDPGKDIKFYLHDAVFDYTGQVGTLTAVSSSFFFGSCQKTASEISVSGSTVTISGNLDFTNAQAVVRFNLVDKATGNPISITSLTVHNPKNSLVKKVDNLAGKLYVSDLTINLPKANNIVFASLSGIKNCKVELTATDGTDVWEYAASKSVTLADGKYYQVKVEMSKAGSSYTVGHFLNKDGSITPKKFTSGTNESVAVIAHAGAVKGYCSEFIAIALEDVSTEMSYWADAMTALDTWAAAHPVTIGGNTYNKNSSGTFYYDKVTPGSDKPSASNTYPAEKGWRMPSVTDWRYIFQSLCGGPSATNPVGVEQNGVYGDKDALRAAINNACGNTNLVDRWYWTSSLLYDEYIEDYAWHYNFWDDGDFSWATKQNMFRTRAVFAY